MEQIYQIQPDPERARNTDLIRESIEAKIKLEAIFKTIHERLNAGENSQMILDATFDLLEKVIPFDRIGIALIENNGESIRLRWVKSRLPMKNLTQDFVAPLKDSSLNDIIKNQRSRIINNLEAYLHDHPGSVSTQKILKDGIRSSLTCPLILNSMSSGVIFFSSAKKDRYNPGHIELFSEISQSLSMIIAQDIFKEKIALIEVKEKMFRDTLHDLVNPLWIIQSALEMIKKKAWFEDLGEDSKKILSMIKRNCDSMINLVEQIVYTVRDEEPDNPAYKEDVNVEKFLTELQEDAAVMAREKKIYIFLITEKQLPNILRFHPLKVKQALKNYIANAIKYNKDESSVTIKVDYKEGHRRLHFTVSDDGQGIPPETLSRLFKEEVRISPENQPGIKSSGRGLMNVKRIIESLGGNVSVKSEPGKGASFSLWIPVIEQN